jgi:hypothetical protein
MRDSERKLKKGKGLKRKELKKGDRGGAKFYGELLFCFDSIDEVTELREGGDVRGCL